MTMLHMCCMRLTAHTFPGLLITLTKKGLLLWKYILLTITNRRTELISLLLIIHFYSYPLLKLKRISILHLTLKGLLITLQLIIRLCMLHLLLIASCGIGLMLWMRIGVSNILSNYFQKIQMLLRIIFHHPKIHF